MSSLVSHLNLKSVTLTVFAVFGYVFVSDFLIHSVLLKDLYQSTQSLWRTPEQMQDNMIWMILGQFLVSKGFAVLFAKGYEGKGVMEGIRFALLLAPIVLAPNFIQYAVTPLPMSILVAWVTLSLIQLLGAGVVAALVYRK